MKRLLVLLFFCFWQFSSSAESSADSLNTVIKELVKTEVETQLHWWYSLTGTSIASISILGIILFFWKSKKIAEDLLKRKAEELIEGKMADKIGVKFELIKKYFQDIEQTQLLRQKRILVVNKDAGKKIHLVKTIEKGGFTSNPVFMKLTELEAGIDTNDFDLLLIDNEDAKFSEEEILNLVDTYKASFKFACFTGVDVSAETFKKLNGVVRFAKDVNYIESAIENALKS